LTHGERANLPLLLAVILGTTVAVSGSLLGLGALLTASAFWFTVVKIIGGVYLLYLGISMLRSGALPTESNPSVRLDSRWKLFANTFFATALNPKSLMFFVAFIPQFINTNSSTATQLWDLAITFIALATSFFLRMLYSQAQHLVTQDHHVYNVALILQLAHCCLWQVSGL